MSTSRTAHSTFTHLDNPMNFIFVLGIGRSGTSLLQCMLDGHPNISFLPETHFIRTYLAGTRSLSSHELLHDKYVARLPSPIVDQLATALHLGTKPLEAYIQMCYSYSEHLSLTPQYVGDKDPRLCEHIPLLKKNFPSSRLIHITRDPRDIVLSRLSAKWSSHYPSILHPIIISAQWFLTMRHSRQIDFTLSYESLTRDPSNTLAQLCSFLNISPSTRMLSFQSSASRLVAEEELQWKSNTFKPLNSSNINKWKSNFTLGFSCFITAACLPHILHCSYEIPPLYRRPFHTLLGFSTYLISYPLSFFLQLSSFIWKK